MEPVGAPDARSATEAVAAFVEVHQSVVSCVTLAVLVGQTYRFTPDVQTMWFGPAVIFLAIAELGVEPLRADWWEILGRADLAPAG